MGVEKPHAVCIPFPAQGHINPMLKVAKLLHNNGFDITFVNTEYNHRRLLKSRGPRSLAGVPSFRFRSIPDGLPPSEIEDATQNIPALCKSTSTACLPHFLNLIASLNASDAPPVSSIISDGVMSFTADAAAELQVSEVLFWTTSACGFHAYTQFQKIIEMGYSRVKDMSHLETEIEGIPGMKGIRLRDLPSFIRTTNKDDDYMIEFLVFETQRARRASAIILNTFEALEHDVLHELSSFLPPIYAIGPLHLLESELDHQLHQLGSNLWKVDTQCLDWLDTQSPNSVVYVNFGSITVMTQDQLTEFAWGLANSNFPFLWIIRPDLVSGDDVVLPPEFVEATRGRGLMATWCPQEKVLNHSSIGGFLTHCGWNSTLESICSGVPMICWPFFAEQQTNCWFSCTKWGIGMEIESGVRMDEVGEIVGSLMSGEKGLEMKKRAMEWKKVARESAKDSSYQNLRKLIDQVLLKV